MGNATDIRFKSGTKYWRFDGGELGDDQSKLACEVDGGTWRLDPVDTSDGKALYVEWSAGKLTYDDVHVTFLKNNKTKTLYDLTVAVATGKNASKNRYNCSLIFFDSTGKNEQMRINYPMCQIVSYSDNGFASDDHGSAATETIVLRPGQGCSVA